MKGRKVHAILAMENSPKEDSLLGFYFGFRGDSFAVKIFFTQYAFIIGICYAIHKYSH